MDYITRAMEATFIRMAQEFSVILLTGPRQVGKTTMLKKLAEAEGANREMAKHDPKLFFNVMETGVMV